MVLAFLLCRRFALQYDLWINRHAPRLCLNVADICVAIFATWTKRTCHETEPPRKGLLVVNLPLLQDIPCPLPIRTLPNLVRLVLWSRLCAQVAHVCPWCLVACCSFHNLSSGYRHELLIGHRYFLSACSNRLALENLRRIAPIMKQETVLRHPMLGYQS